MTYRRRYGRAAQGRQNVKKKDLARFNAKMFARYEANRRRGQLRTWAVILVVGFFAGVAGWLVAG